VPLVLRALLALTAATVLLAARPAVALDVQDDPLHACDRAAARSERDWNLPAGLLERFHHDWK
jgi:hypothetical protein